jgi:hypothetical protein
LGLRLQGSLFFVVPLWSFTKVIFLKGITMRHMEASWNPSSLREGDLVLYFAENKLVRGEFVKWHNGGQSAEVVDVKTPRGVRPGRRIVDTLVLREDRETIMDRQASINHIRALEARIARLEGKTARLSGAHQKMMDSVEAGFQKSLKEIQSAVSGFESNSAVTSDEDTLNPLLGDLIESMDSAKSLGEEAMSALEKAFEALATAEGEVEKMEAELKKASGKKASRARLRRRRF